MITTSDTHALLLARGVTHTVRDIHPSHVVKQLVEDEEHRGAIVKVSLSELIPLLASLALQGNSLFLLGRIEGEENVWFVSKTNRPSLQRNMEVVFVAPADSSIDANIATFRTLYPAKKSRRNVQSCNYYPNSIIMRGVTITGGSIPWKQGILKALRPFAEHTFVIGTSARVISLSSSPVGTPRHLVHEPVGFVH